MPMALVTSLISAISIIVGSLVGAFFSWLINKNMHKKKIEEDCKVRCENRKYEEHYRAKDICRNANIIRLDIATALFQSIRSIKNESQSKEYLYLLPINKEYSSAVASLNDRYTLKELSDLYQLYGIIEKVNRDIYNWKVGDNESYDRVRLGFFSILYKIYGDDFNNVLKVDIDKITYNDLYKNEYINKNYRDLLTKLDSLCILDNLLESE